MYVYISTTENVAWSVYVIYFEWDSLIYNEQNMENGKINKNKKSYNKVCYLYSYVQANCRKAAINAHNGRL